MSERIHVLAQQLFGKPLVEECNLHEVKDIALHYPYFAPGQFLLLEKLKQENSPDYIAQLQKAVLYYHNPIAFEYFISSDSFYTEPEFEEEPETEEESVLSNEPEPMDHPEPEIKNETIAVEKEEEQAAEQLQTANPEPQTSNDLVFEPYHTVDYFASQGIKLLQEEVPKDKFGKQLKSFTEWLKTMKRLPAKEISNTVDTVSEKNVEHLAEDSVHETDIVTEAMAEVWIKQGNKEKALEVYNKLGLLNPSKRAYFAALIENLKTS